MARWVLAEEGRDLCRDDTMSMDECGQVADNLDGARAIAQDGARELVCEQVRRGYLNLDNYIIVADQSGHELTRVMFRDAFVVHTKSWNDNQMRGEGGKLPD